MLNARERRVVEVLDMKCIKRTVGVSVMKQIRCMSIRGECGNKRSLFERVDKSILKWFLHMEMTHEGKFTKIVIQSGDGWMPEGRVNLEGKRSYRNC